jgi:hypothetical protein
MGSVPRAVKHITTMRVVGLATTMIVGGGCSGYRTQRAASPPSTSFSAPPAGLATICVFRAQGLGTSVVAPVSDNGAIVGATEGTSYFCYQAEPGPHRIRTADAPALAIRIKEGKSYFLAHDLNVGADTLIRIKRESAEQLSAWCGEVEVNAAPSGVAVLKRGEIARADLPRPLRVDAGKPAAAAGTKVAAETER